jgi:hypothetical protein
MKVRVLAPNKLQRTVTRRRGDDAVRAPFHYARTSRFTRQRAAAEQRRLAGQPMELGRG